MQNADRVAGGSRKRRVKDSGGAKCSNDGSENQTERNFIMQRVLSVGFTLVMFALTATGRAEKVNMSARELQNTATHVVTGTVRAIYHREETVGRWHYERFVAEIRVEASEKGEGLEPGHLLYARYWHRTWRGDGFPPPSTSGHRGLPKAGDHLRVYLARNAYDGFTNDNHDGGYNVIGANGFEPYDPASPTDDANPE